MPDVTPAAMLGATPMFRGLAAKDLEELARHMVPRTYRRGESIFHRGDPAGALHYIETGNVKVTLTTEDGKETVLALFGPGAWFGEISALDGGPRSASVTATKVVAPVAFQCAVWGGAGALVGGGVVGAAAGCVTGATSYLLQEYGPNNAYLQCAVWGVGGAVSAPTLAKAGILGAGGCVGGVAGFFEDSSKSSQCTAWALAGAVSFALNPAVAARAWATGVGCFAGAASTAYGAELGPAYNTRKE